MADTTLISVRVPKELARRLARLAESTDRSMSRVAGQAIEELVTLEEWQVKAIKQGIAQANRGELHSHDVALKKLAKWKARGR